MNRPTRAAIGLLTCAAALGAGVEVIAAQGWSHARHDAHATARAEESGTISALPGSGPGIAHVRSVDQRVLGRVLLRDVDLDGTPEALMIHDGRAAALDLTSGEFHWKSGFDRLDELLAIGDFSELDDDDVLLGLSADLDGGVYALELSMGGVVGSLDGLSQRTGIARNELVFFDLDEDGRDELVFTAAVSGVAKVWAASFAAGYDTGERVEHPFEGYSNLTPPRAGYLLDGGLALNVDQGPRQTLLSVCSPAEPEASCDGGGDEALCLCPEAVFEGVFPSYAFGQSHVVDVDGDGVDEIVSVASHPSFVNAISVLSFADGLAMGVPDTQALRRWYRGYPGAVPHTFVVSPEQTPTDLDGDGSVDLVVNFVNDIDLDVDEHGAPIDDGISLPGRVGFAVFSAATGEVLLSRADEFVYGWVDLDGDERLELVSSPTAEWTWLPGLSGHELDCTGPCTLTPRWTAPGRQLHRDLDSINDVGVPIGPSWLRVGARLDPPVELLTLDVDEDGDLELLAYHGGTLEALDAQGVAASVALAPAHDVRGVDAAGGFVVVGGDTSIQLLDRQLGPVAAPVPVPSQGFGRWFTFRPRPAKQHVAPVFDGEIFLAGLDQAPSAVELLPNFVLAEDLDDDGNTEVLSLRRAADGEGVGFELRLHSWDPIEAAFVQLWTRASAGDPELEAWIPYDTVHIATGDFDGEGARDVVLPIASSGAVRFLILDGSTGATEALLSPSSPAASYAPAAILDLASADGTLTPDGLDDVLMAGSSRIQLLTPGHDGPLTNAANDIGHTLGLNADLTGDGVPELVGVINATTDNAIEASFAAPNHGRVWGPRALGRVSGRVPVLAVAELDDAAGLEPIHVNGDGGIEALSGLDGVSVPGFPVYVSGGALYDAAPAQPEVATALAVADIDGDGHDEAIVGTRGGWIYAVNIAVQDAAPPTLEWAFELGSALGDIAVGDSDSDGEAELLVSTRDGRGFVIDALGVELTIFAPQIDSCLEFTHVLIEGTATNVATVDLEVNAIPGDQGIDAGSGSWAGEVEVNAAGTHAIEAVGRDLEGEIVALATREISFGGDDDGDGITICGGDCDDSDPARHPGALEICEDGVDQDCDGEDQMCAAEDSGDEGGGSESSGGAGGDDGGDEGGGETGGAASGGGVIVEDGCSCAADPNGRKDRGRAGLGLLCLLVLVRRRR